MHLMPQTRIALIRDDSLAAAIFEEPKVRRGTAVFTAAASAAAGGSVGGIGSSRGGGVVSSRGALSRGPSYNLLTTQQVCSGHPKNPPE